jgi:hypothetical protein
MVINTAESMTQEKGSNVGKFLMPTLHYRGGSKIPL